MHHAAQRATLNDQLQGQKIAVKTPVLEHRQDPTLRLSQVKQTVGFSQRDGARLVDHHMFASLQGTLGQLKMTGVWGGDHHQVNRRVTKHGAGTCDTTHVGPVSCHRDVLAGHNAIQLQAWHTRDQRRMKDTARAAITNQGHLQGWVLAGNLGKVSGRHA